MDARAIETADFGKAGETDWQTLVDRALKGADFDTLVSRTDDGIAYGPIAARRADCTPIARVDGSRPWLVTQRLDDIDAARAATQAREDIAEGADCLTLVTTGTHAAYGFGLPMPAGPTFAAILDAVDPALVTLRHEGSALGARALADQLARHESRTEGAPVHFGVDPVSAAAFAGDGYELDRQLVDHIRPLLDARLAGTVLRADGRLAHNSGASEAQELGVILAALVACLRACESGGLSPEHVLATTELAVAVDQDQFVSIAKLRALRLLHSRLADACGAADARPPLIHAETSYRMLARKDPETNILRSTIAAFAAGVGGADSIAILPHTLALGLPDAFARRIARNTQVLLIHESHLDHVLDPSAGAGGIEALTDALAERAWDEFRAIEAEGGIMKSLQTGAIRQRIAETGERRAAAIAGGEHPIVGTTLYPAAVERPVRVLADAPQSKAPKGALRPMLLADAWKGDAA